MKTEEVASGVVKYLLGLQDGMEISTAEAIKEVYGCETEDFNALMNIDDCVRKMVRKHGLILDNSRYKELPVGLPFNIPYVIKRKGK